MLIALLEPAGADLARRWVAALMLVPSEEREEVVRRVEYTIAQTYGSRDNGRELNVAHPPEDHGSYVEQVITTYEIKPGAETGSDKLNKPRPA